MTGDAELPDLSHLNVVGPNGETAGRIVHYVQPARKEGPFGQFTPALPTKIITAIVVGVDPVGDPELVVISIQARGLHIDGFSAPYSPVLREGHWSWPVKT